MNAERRYTIVEAAPLLWLSVDAFMHILQRQPRYIEYVVNYETYTRKGITWEQAQTDPDRTAKSG